MSDGRADILPGAFPRQLVQLSQASASRDSRTPFLSAIAQGAEEQLVKPVVALPRMTPLVPPPPAVPLALVFRPPT